MSTKPGDRLEARCTRCKDITGHIAVVVLDDIISKVECCSCKSIHKYYPPKKEKVAKPASPVRVRADENRTEVVKKKTTRAAPKQEKITKAAKAQEEISLQWKTAIAKNPATPVPYAMDGAFELAALIDHSKFGIGMVLAVYAPDKIEVLFEEGIKALRCKI